MKTNEIRKLSTEEINKKIAESKEELFNLRMKQATGSACHSPVLRPQPSYPYVPLRIQVIISI